jgi:hypothetical protein
MARNQGAIDRLADATRGLPHGRGEWRRLDDRVPERLWTDDYASVMPLLYKMEISRWLP